MNLKGYGNGLIKILYWHLPVGTAENHKNPQAV
jgi:hypothetical protein